MVEAQAHAQARAPQPLVLDEPVEPPQVLDEPVEPPQVQVLTEFVEPALGRTESQKLLEAAVEGYYSLTEPPA